MAVFSKNLRQDENLSSAPKHLEPIRYCLVSRAGQIGVPGPTWTISTFSRHFVAPVTFGAQLVMCRVLQHSLGTLHRRFYPQLNFHRARVHRNHGRPRSNGFTGTRRTSRLRSLLSENAHPVKRLPRAKSIWSG